MHLVDLNEAASHFRRMWRMWLYRIAFTSIGVAFAAVIAGAGWGTTGHANLGRSGKCIAASQIAPSPASLDEALHAARRLIPPTFRARVNPWANAPRIVEIALLQPNQPDVPGLGEARAIASRRCGAELAGASWVVAVDFPRARVNYPISVMFIVKTRTGWRLWYRLR